MQVVARDRAQRPTVTPTEPDFGALHRVGSLDVFACRCTCRPFIIRRERDVTTLGDVEIFDNGLHTFECAEIVNNR